jgi:hypothetical protein
MWTADNRGRLRRAWRLHVEMLEDRTLLAGLELSAGLGQLTSLDYVQQTAHYLQNVAAPGTQQVPQTDGTAYSTVTLTSAASATGSPGLNLDILAQQSVNDPGPASVGLNAGLSNSIGQIGASIPVSIYPTNPQEVSGAPVVIKFNLAFNVKSFGDQTATADLDCDSNYTYMGQTTTLQVNDDDLGGYGPRMVGPGPVTYKTETLNAHIGDTFTLSFSVDLSGETMAPFLVGVALNNVNWTVDANLDVSIEPPAPTKTTVTTAPSSVADFGQNVTFTTVVQNVGDSQNPPPPAGEVQFFVDGAKYRDPVNMISGAASISDADLTVGSHQITAEFMPQFLDVLASTSEIAAGLVIQADETQTTVTTSPRDLLDFGQMGTLIATVDNVSDSDQPATPTGAVQFFIDNLPYGVPVALVNGTASVSETDQPVGYHQITASYTPEDGNFAQSTTEEPAIAQIQPDSTETTVTTNPPALANVGQSMALTATVNNISESEQPATPTGTVQFFADGLPYGAPAALMNGMASVTATNLLPGSHQITAAYTSDGPNFAESSSDVGALLAIQAVGPGTRLVAVSGSGTYGGTATLLAVLTINGLPSSGQPIAFTLLRNGSSTSVGTVSTNSNGLASLSGVSLAGFSAGTYTGAVVASLPNSPTSSPLSGTLTVRPTALIVTANDLTFLQGQPVPRFSDTITGFVNGDTSSVVTGAATLTSSAGQTSPVGAYPISAGVGTLSASNYVFTTFLDGTLTINPVPATSLTSVTGSAGYGGTAALTATLTSKGAPVPGKAIAFTVNEAGTATPIGVATTNASGIASLTNVSLAGYGPGVFFGVVRASFTGDSADLASSGTGDLNVINPVALAPILTQTAIAGDTVSFTATATDTDAGATLGYLLENGAPAGASIDPKTGMFSWTIPTSQSTGDYTVTVEAIEESVLRPSATSTFVLDVQQLTSLSAVQASGSVGGAITLTATASSKLGSPIGDSIAFLLNEDGVATPVGSATIGNFGVATLSGVSLAGFSAGTYPGVVEAAFAGDASHAASSASGNLTVAPLSVPQNPLNLATIANQAVTPGGTVTVTASASETNGSATFLYLLAAGAPQGASINSKSGVFSWSVPASQSPGSYPVTVDVVDNSSPPLSNMASFTIDVQRPTVLSAVSGIGTFGGSIILIASLASNGSPAVGKTVAFTLNEGGTPTPVGTATTSKTGVARLGGISLNGFSPGTLSDGVQASFVGDATDAASNASGNLTISTPSGINYTVNSLADTGAGTGFSGDLRYAIIQADNNPGSTIEFAVTGTIALKTALPDLSEDVTINGPGVPSLTIQGFGSPSPFSSVSVFNVDSGVVASISGVTVSGNSDAYSGAVENAGNLTLTNCTISGNSSQRGGGVYNSGTLSMTDCMVANNNGNNNGVGGKGGGLENTGTLTITNCTFSDNHAAAGGAIINYGSSYIYNSNISNNTISNGFNGAGVYNSGNMTLIDSVLSGNQGHSVGGAVYNSGTLSLTGDTIVGNSAYSGAGIYSQSGSLTVSDSTISANTLSPAGGRGGGVFLGKKMAGATISNCLLSGNTAAYGGAIFDDAPLILTNCAVSRNVALNGGGGLVTSSTAESTLSDCTFSGNVVNNPNQTSPDSAGGRGGGAILNISGGAVTLIDCTLSDNSVQSFGKATITPAFGGGGMLNGGAMMLIESTVSGNSIIPAPGGGILNYGFGHLSLISSTVSGNSSGTAGGGIGSTGTSATSYNNSVYAYPYLRLVSSTIDGNTAPLGGGLEATMSNLVITNSTITANEATNFAGGGGINADNVTGVILDDAIVAGNLTGPSPGTLSDDVTGPIDPSSTFNLIGDGDLLMGLSNGAQGNLIGSAIAGTVINPHLGPLMNNGGPVPNVALLPGSPANMAGPNGSAIGSSASQFTTATFTPTKPSPTPTPTPTSTKTDPTLVVTDSGGVYNGSPFPAAFTIAGSDGIAGTSLEDVTPILSYYVATKTFGLGARLPGPPSAAGVYVAVASFVGTADYNSISVNAPYDIQPAQPIISWVPGSIVAGASLGPAQLEATTSVPGTFTYTPGAGTTVHTGQLGLSVYFQPTDSIDYYYATAMRIITVLPSGASPTSTSTPTGTTSPSSSSTVPQLLTVTPVAFRKGLTALTLNFNEPLTAASASNSVLYRVFAGVTKVVKKHRETLFTKALSIRNVSPNSSNNAVTLSLAKPFKGTVQVTVQGTVTAANGASDNVNTSRVVR